MASSRGGFFRHQGRVVALAMLFAIAGCRESGRDAKAPSHVLAGRAMGTTWRVVLRSAEVDAKALQTGTSALLEELESKLSHWRADSEVSRFNRAGAGVPVPVSAETARVVLFGEEMRAASGGAFDIRVAGRVAARGFGPKALVRDAPAPDAPGGSITVHLTPPSLTKSKAGLVIDLSAYAKGHAVDRIAGFLEGKNIQHYLVEVGGEIKARGANAKGKPWSAGVEAPVPERREIHLLVRLKNEAIATSGNYRIFRKEVDGSIQSHLVDPREGGTGEPAFRSVSVIASETMNADAWATALYVLGEVAGLQMAKERGLAVCFLRVSDGGEVEEKMTAGFRERVIP